jgi:hydrogenase expression/formation protein HypC
MCLAVPGRIIRLGNNDMASIDIMGNVIEASVRLTPQAKIGDYVLIHAGFVVEIIDEAMAHDTLDIFAELEKDKQ